MFEKIIHKVDELIAPLPSNMPQEAFDFVRDKHQGFQVRMAATGIAAYMVINLLSIPGLFFLGTPDVWGLGLLGTVILTIGCLLVTQASQDKKDSYLIYASLLYGFQIGLCIPWHSLATLHSTTLDERWVQMLSLFAIVAIAILFGPDWKKKSRQYLFFLVVPLFAATTADRPILVMFMLLFALSGAIVIRHAIHRTFFSYTIKEYGLKQLEIHQLESELVLARKIHTSFVNEAISYGAGGLEFRTYQTRHFEIGGDWAIHRSFENKRTVILVADATGKGIQAALVIHALQALWARSLVEDYFEVEEFIHEVNVAMLTLGRNERHSLTMGILDFNEERFKYWSAGHTPLYVVKGRGKNRRVNSLASTGNPLGITEKVNLVSASGVWDDASDMSLMFGTDGLFSSGTATKKREALEILDAATKGGERSLQRFGVADDKTLIVVERRKKKSVNVA